MFNFFAKKEIRPFVMVILDGWGIAPVWGGNAISQARIKNFNDISKKYPSTCLAASDGAVGLSLGSPGNSEAGHLNIGAGEIVHQDEPIIDESIQNRSFFNNKVLLGAFAHAKERHSRVNFVGLLSKTGTHSQVRHLYALLELAKQENFNNINIHLFADGRDSDTLSGIEMVSEVEGELKKFGAGRVASIIGRFYAMDRDNHWDRIAKAYHLMVDGVGKTYSSSGAVFTNSYARGVTDEFIEPSLILNKNQSSNTISDHDSVIFFNFRADRAREITRSFLDDSLPEFPGRNKLTDLYFASFVMHEEKTLALETFAPNIVKNPLAEVWSKSGIKQFHIAETEKYAHVTYYLNGGIEKPFPGEDRLMIPSPRVKTYDLAPEMSAKIVTDNLVTVIKKNIYGGIVVNFANPDMVGHTGNLKAAIKAVEFVDECLGRVLREVISKNGVAFIFADHGNAEQMVNPRTGSPDTEHTTNPVPFIMVSDDSKLSKIKFRKGGNLASIAPTVLELSDLSFDSSAKEKSLIIK